METYKVSDIYRPKILKRQYKMPKGFPSLSQLLADEEFEMIYGVGSIYFQQLTYNNHLTEIPDFCIEGLQSYCSTSRLSLDDKRLALGTAACLSGDPPVYALDQKLLAAFQATKPTFLQDLPFDDFILCLPSFSGALLKKVTFGEDFLETPNLSSMVFQSIFFVSNVDDGILWSSYLQNKNGPSFTLFSTWNYGEKSDGFLGDMLFHTIAYINAYVESPDVDKPIKSKAGIGFGNASKQPKTIFRPRMVSSAHKGLATTNHVRYKSQSSLTPHWRRGHWHKYRVGPGRKEERFNWIEPTLVGANNE